MSSTLFFSKNMALGDKRILLIKLMSTLRKKGNKTGIILSQEAILNARVFHEDENLIRCLAQDGIIFYAIREEAKELGIEDKLLECIELKTYDEIVSIIMNEYERIYSLC